jgi:hypothetical protein
VSGVAAHDASDVCGGLSVAHKDEQTHRFT